MVPWRRHRCCQGDPELAQLPPNPSQDVCPCPGCAVAISRALCLPRPASLIHGTPESRGLGPCSPLSSVCGPAETPGSLLASPSLQPLTKACCGMMLFPIKAGQVEEKEGGRHCILVSQCERWGWHSAQRAAALCCINTCIKSHASPAQDQAKGKILSKDLQQCHS